MQRFRAYNAPLSQGVPRYAPHTNAARVVAAVLVSARWDEYIDSQKRIAKAAADAGAAAIVSNHSEYDNAYTKARLIGAKREVGENHPFVVGADGVQRYFTVMTECATAAKLRAGAK